MNSNLMTVKQLAEAIPSFSVGGIRHWLFYDIDHFRTRCAFKIGSRVMLDADAVAAWVEAHRGGE